MTKEEHDPVYEYERRKLAYTEAMLERQEYHRDRLGRRVRDVWLAWARQQPQPKPSWLVEYDELTEAEKEVDRRIGAALWGDGFADGVDSIGVSLLAQPAVSEDALRARIKVLENDWRNNALNCREPGYANRWESCANALRAALANAEDRDVT